MSIITVCRLKMFDVHYSIVKLLEFAKSVLDYFHFVWLSFEIIGNSFLRKHEIILCITSCMQIIFCRLLLCELK